MIAVLFDVYAWIRNGNAQLESLDLSSYVRHVRYVFRASAQTLRRSCSAPLARSDSPRTPTSDMRIHTSVGALR